MIIIPSAERPLSNGFALLVARGFSQPLSDPSVRSVGGLLTLVCIILVQWIVSSQKFAIVPRQGATDMLGHRSVVFRL